MKALTLNEIAKAVQGKNELGDWGTLSVSKVAFDTRKIEVGSLFVPLQGNADGHDYLADAMKSGATASFWSRPLAEAPKDFPVIQVEDTLQALQDLASYYLALIQPKVVGITGSNGKTTTKDMTEAVVSAKYKVHKTQGNFNNQIGLPITILEMPEDTEVAILEMGMNHPGEIAELSLIAKPDIAVITMIGEAHIEYFGSREKIAQTKMEIVKGLKPEGVLIIPGEEPLLQAEIQKIMPINYCTFGQSPLNDIHVLTTETQMKETHFTMNLAPELSCKIPVIGQYNVNNALAALMVGKQLAVPVTDAVEKLATFGLTKSRTEWIPGMNDSQILNDAYNANPTAMNAVLDSFSALELNGRKLVVLGDMLELGELSTSLHESVAAHLNPEHISEVFLFGPEMEKLSNKLTSCYAPEKLHYYSTDKAALIEALKATIKKEDQILVKASNGTGLGEVIEAIKQTD
ncbi:UDP-N-acetylmuramoyl-tripeptide--D-alanyl-D-alanine ligase [Isobaculum melis]|uniref:UDP-N-acetylmuramoyl-tripeptide--D-alanyl-D-alanine ligase n=1 Tax=Isobaculum melis TaxID=142588 RepID=A0A1H9U2D4_9LACT|nr:UDP-N-acetylmuramoyl-tripeptide--D-alanyl-D-alanine ligase [Isobaculum melis]SES03408.1 UDP-N-acetylmuramoyl-tripeptide--D-alanyl-D-alanine ligase [Isobaculum melis]